MEHHESTRQARQERGVFSVDSAGQVGLPRYHSPRTCARLRFCQLVLLFGGAAALGGCVLSATTITSGVPLDPVALSQIRLGKTTGTEVMRLLGPPHSIIRGNAQFREAGGLDYPAPSGPLSSRGYYSYAKDRQFSSLDDKHYALFYKYGKTRARSRGFRIAGITGRREVRVGGEELLIILDVERDVVTDVASHWNATPP